MNFNFEYLKHGKALCGKVFKRFVETFNLHNDFISNLKGDADLPTEGGNVNVDTTDPSHPVIRCKGCGGGSSSGGTSTTAPSPFRFTVEESEDPETHEPTIVGQISNCNFYWDGVLKTLSDFTPPATCTVYLCCTQAAPSSSGEAEWQFSIATSPAQATSGGRVVNYKLYDIADNKVTMDYRTTFVELNSPHKVAYFRVGKYEGDEYHGIVSDATNNNYKTLIVRQNGVIYCYAVADMNYALLRSQVDNYHKAEMRAESSEVKLTLTGSKSVIISEEHLLNGSEAKFHTLTVTHSDGTETKYDVLSDKDISITEGGGGELPDKNVLVDVTFNYKDGNLYVAKTTYNLKTRQETVGSEELVFTTEEHSAQS